MFYLFLWSQTISAKVYSQEGNSPDYLIRTLILFLVERM